MHRAVWGSIGLILVACEPMEPSGDIFAPARDANSSFVEVENVPEPASPEPETTQAADSTEPDADADSTPEEPASDDPMARLLAVRDAADAAAQEEAESSEADPEPTAGTGWEPGNELGVSWGVVLLSTDTMSQPPTAVLGLPDGRSVVTSAGDMLPEVGVVVVAVGVDVAQIASVEPMGDRARVSTSVMRAMHPSVE